MHETGQSTHRVVGDHSFPAHLENDMWGTGLVQGHHYVCVCAQSCPTLCDPMDYNLPGSSLSMGFLRQEYLSGLPLPSPGDLLNPRIEPTSVASPALTDIGEAITKYQVPQAEWLQQQKFIFLQFWRLEAQGQGVGNVGFILRPFSLTCRQWSFPDVSTWSSLCVL